MTGFYFFDATYLDPSTLFYIFVTTVLGKPYFPLARTLNASTDGPPLIDFLGPLVSAIPDARLKLVTL